MLGFQNFDQMRFNCTESIAITPVYFCRKPKHPNKNTRLPYFDSWCGQRRTSKKFVTSTENKWKVSHISGQSFEDNKNFNINVLPKKATSFLFTHRTIPFKIPKQWFPIRTFKTTTSVFSKKSKTDNFLEWLRSLFGITPKLASEKDEASSVDALKGRLFETELGKADDKVKIAFAEGYVAGAKHTPNRFWKMLQPFFTTMCVIGILVVVLSTSGSLFRFQVGKHIDIDPVEIHVTFDDVKGVDEAKQELEEVVEFLRNPGKFTALGGKLPKGVLLVGPPGTGKTLLARAVAGEAGVPFFHAAGSEFDEILVGQGARRVRDLFKAAKENAPCVIFIDEIDSVGAKRTTSVLHPYANQTINQLLSEMDGFHQNEGIIVLGATNRRDDLDKALLRPGRFDVEVVVPTPDYAGRKDILNFYLRKILFRDVDVDQLARGTTGFTGADIENMLNQAALKAAIEGAEFVSMYHIEEARDKMLMGPEKKTRIPDEETNIITAYHEGGHTIVGFYTKDAFPLHKVTIVPRGHSLGHTAYLADKEQYHVTKAQMLARMDALMGGRAAEELIFGPEKITSGAASDLKQATTIATHMVKDWGMSDKIGVRTLDESNKSCIVVNEFGQHTNDIIDSEIKRILQESYERAKNILKAHTRELKILAEALMKYETLDADDIKAILGVRNNIKNFDNFMFPNF